MTENIISEKKWGVSGSELNVLVRFERKFLELCLTFRKFWKTNE